MMFFDKLNGDLSKSAAGSSLNSVRALSHRIPATCTGGGNSRCSLNGFKGIFLAVAIFFAPLYANAHTDTTVSFGSPTTVSDTSGTNQEIRKEVYVGFPVSRTVLDLNFGDNAERLSEIVSFLTDVQQDTTIELTGVSFRGSASPEGGPKLNQNLAKNRRNALEKYIRSRVEIADSLITRHEEAYIAWDRLAELVEASDMQYKEDVLRIIREVPEFTFSFR